MKLTNFNAFGGLLAAFLCLNSAISLAAQSSIQTEKVTDNIYMLTGPGGNVGLFVGEDANFLVDDKYEAQGSDILNAVAEVTDQPIDYLINTHWHGDHTGSNHVIGETGATIVAHDNVRTLLASGSKIEMFDAVIKPQPKEGLPEITFAEKLSFHANGEVIHVQHYAHAHTDGDAVLYFEKANVVVTGDLFFNGFYPFIDSEHGGRLKGVIDGVEKILARTDADTVIVPGHGPLASIEDLQAYKAMLEATVAAIEPLKQQGLSLAQVIAKKPTQALDGQWGNGPFKPEAWVKFAYHAL